MQKNPTNLDFGSLKADWPLWGDYNLRLPKKFRHSGQSFELFRRFTCVLSQILYMVEFVYRMEFPPSIDEPPKDAISV